jgi:hypothetical protein
MTNMVILKQLFFVILIEGAGDHDHLKTETGLAGVNNTTKPDPKQCLTPKASGNTPLARSRAPQQLPKKEFALSEPPQGASLQTPGSCEDAQGIRRRRTSDTGALSFGSFL